MEKTKFKLTFFKEDGTKIFTTFIYSTSMNGAKIKAEELQPFSASGFELVDVVKNFISITEE